MVVARGWGERKMESYCLMSIEFQFYKMKRVLEMGVVMVVQQCECIQYC